MRRLTNLILLGAVAVLAASGLLGWVLPEPAASPLYALHRMAGIVLVLALPWKEVIARASLARRARARAWPSAIPGIAAATALAVTIAIGLAWTAGVVTFDRPFAYSPLNVHVFAGLALVPLAAWHVIRRWEPPRTRDLTARRNVIRLAGLSVLALAAGSFLERFPPGRRLTGSKHAGSFTGNDFPLTAWAFDGIPALDGSAWRVELAGAIRSPASLGYADLVTRATTEIDAILDCTGGWWTEQRWRGVALLDLLAERGLERSARRVTVRSVTGHSWTFPIAELRSAIVATHVGGEALSPGHGYPARLVVPGKRGFQWIKWVARIEIS